jgi:predicted regulator of Ras-like GTPase activity (Roadblock/LC7/MglB family)
MSAREAMAMQTLLEELNAIPGVVGSLVCGAGGEVLAQAFPPLFDREALAGAAKVVAESTAGLDTVTGAVQLLDLRYASARLVVRPVTGGNLLFLCSPSMNLQPLAISVSVAVPKLEALVAERAGAAPVPDRAPATPAGAPGQLQAAVQRINEVIERKRIDPFTARGEIALKAGFGLGFIDADTPDDPEKLSRLKVAAQAVLGESIEERAR